MGPGREGTAREQAGPPVTARKVPHVRKAAPAALLRLQASAGNTAVSGLVALQRQGACPVPAPAPAGVTPAADPKFRSLTKDIEDKAKTSKAHPPPGAEVKKAQDAAVAPADDKDAQAKAAQADKMAAAKPGGFDKAAFVAAVNAAIAKQAPKNLDEADTFATSGKADQIKTEVMGKVTAGKDASAKDVTDKTKETPDTAKGVEKPVTPLPVEPAPPAPAPPDAKKAVPDKAPPEQTDLRADQCDTNSKMAEAGVTEGQLAQSNEPEFTGALAAKKTGEQHTATAPAAVRESEAGRLTAATGNAQASGQTAVAAMAGARTTGAQRGQAAKSATKTKDEQDRAKITAEIKAVFDDTKTKVETVLNGLDGEVAKRFTAGEAEAKAAFTADHQARMKKYRAERYDGISGAARWTYDLFASLPPEANNLFLEAKKVYESKMQTVIGGIADYVGEQLAQAKTLISDGRARVKEKVDSKSPALRKIAGDAAKEFGEQFDDLEKSVDEKQQAVVDDLAEKYVEARNAVDEEIKALQAENKGWWDKAKEAVGGAIETIGKLKDMLLGVLARAAGAIELIIKDPIGFLGNLVNAVKTGVMNFGSNIVEHLKSGLKGWLLGNLAAAGIEIPETFDVKGILKMIMSILGLTWASVRARILRFIPEPILAKLESTFEVVKIMVTEGIPGLWRWVVEKLGDLKEMVLGQIKEFVVEKIVKAGITWIISLLNPAAAFIKACKAIYDIVMFFVDKAAQIKEFVDSVLDSVESIARGGAGAVAGLIERTLAKALPMVLGFLASLLGLGGISEKIKSILEKVQAPVAKVVDTVVGTVVKAGKKLFSKLRGKKDKKADPEGADVKAKARRALLDAVGQGASLKQIEQANAAILSRLRPEGLKKLELRDHGEHSAVVAEASPEDDLALFMPPKPKCRMDITLKLRPGASPLEGVTTRFTAKASTRNDAGQLVDANGKVVTDPWASMRTLPAPLDPTRVDFGGRVKGYRGSQTPTGQVRSGAVLMPPTQGSNELTVVAWNTGEHENKFNTNVTHAERQFTTWISNATSREWKGRVESISAKITLSPCTDCTPDLIKVAKEIEKQVPHGATKPVLSITYDRPYIGKGKNLDLSTTPESLAALRAHWNVHGDPVAGEGKLIPQKS